MTMRRDISTSRSSGFQNHSGKACSGRQLPSSLSMNPRVLVFASIVLPRAKSSQFLLILVLSLALSASSKEDVSDMPPPSANTRISVASEAVEMSHASTNDSRVSTTELDTSPSSAVQAPGKVTTAPNTTHAASVKIPSAPDPGNLSSSSSTVTTPVRPPAASITARASAAGGTSTAMETLTNILSETSVAVGMYSEPTNDTSMVEQDKSTSSSSAAAVAASRVTTTSNITNASINLAGTTDGDTLASAAHATAKKLTTASIPTNKSAVEDSMTMPASSVTTRSSSETSAATGTRTVTVDTSASPPAAAVQTLDTRSTSPAAAAEVQTTAKVTPPPVTTPALPFCSEFLPKDRLCKKCSTITCPYESGLGQEKKRYCTEDTDTTCDKCGEGRYWWGVLGMCLRCHSCPDGTVIVKACKLYNPKPACAPVQQSRTQPPASVIPATVTPTRLTTAPTTTTTPDGLSTSTTPVIASASIHLPTTNEVDTSASAQPATTKLMTAANTTNTSATTAAETSTLMTSTSTNSTGARTVTVDTSASPPAAAMQTLDTRSTSPAAAEVKTTAKVTPPPVTTPALPFCSEFLPKDRPCKKCSTITCPHESGLGQEKKRYCTEDTDTTCDKCGEGRFFFLPIEACDTCYRCPAGKVAVKACTLTNPRPVCAPATRGTAQPAAISTTHTPPAETSPPPPAPAMTPQTPPVASRAQAAVANGSDAEATTSPANDTQPTGGNTTRASQPASVPTSTANMAINSPTKSSKQQPTPTKPNVHDKGPKHRTVTTTVIIASVVPLLSITLGIDHTSSAQPAQIVATQGPSQTRAYSHVLGGR